MPGRPSSAAPASEPVNFRTRTANRKREAMKQRLLQATLTVCSVETSRNPAVIDDVIKEAQVSRGTFYKYFESLEEATSELGRSLMMDLIHSVDAALAEIEDPYERVIAGPLLFIAHAAQDRRWGAFVSSIDHLDDAGEVGFIRDSVSRDLLEARAMGVVSFVSLDSAMDLLVGALRQGVRRLVAHGPRDIDQILEFVVMNMLALGMSRAKAVRAVQRTWHRLQAMDLGALEWLRELPGAPGGSEITGA